MRIGKPFIRALIATGVLVAAFVLAAVVVPPDTLSVVIRVMLFLACLLGVYRWGPTAARVYTNGASLPHEQGIMAIVILLLAIIANQTYSVVYIVMDRPFWFTQYHVSGFITYVMLIGVVLFSVSTRIEGEKHSPMLAAILGALSALSVAIASLWPTIASKGGTFGSFLSRVL